MSLEVIIIIFLLYLVFVKCFESSLMGGCEEITLSSKYSFDCVEVALAFMRVFHFPT